MAKIKLSKEQRREVSARNRAARMRQAKANMGETIAQKLGLTGGAVAVAKMPGGYEVGKMNVQIPMVTGLLGYGVAIVAGGKIGAVAEGLGDASLAIGIDRKLHKPAAGAVSRNAGEEPEASGAWRLPARSTSGVTLAEAERRGFLAGKAQGLQQGVQAGVAGTLDLVDEADAQGLA